MQVESREIKLNNNETGILTIVTYTDNEKRFIIEDNYRIIGSSKINKKQALYNYNRNRKRAGNNIKNTH